MLWNLCPSHECASWALVGKNLHQCDLYLPIRITGGNAVTPANRMKKHPIFKNDLCPVDLKPFPCPLKYDITVAILVNIVLMESVAIDKISSVITNACWKKLCCNIVCWVFDLLMWISTVCYYNVQFKYPSLFSSLPVSSCSIHSSTETFTNGNAIFMTLLFHHEGGITSHTYKYILLLCVLYPSAHAHSKCGKHCKPYLYISNTSKLSVKICHVFLHEMLVYLFYKHELLFIYACMCQWPELGD